MKKHLGKFRSDELTKVARINCLADGTDLDSETISRQRY